MDVQRRAHLIPRRLPVDPDAVRLRQWDTPVDEDLKVAPEKAKALADQGQAVFLDTRSPEDFARGDRRLPGSLRVAPEQVMARRARWRAADAVIAYCT